MLNEWCCTSCSYRLLKLTGLQFTVSKVMATLGLQVTAA